MKKIKIAEQGDKITEKFCPHCHDELVVKVDGDAEVFECENCKFKIKKK